MEIVHVYTIILSNKAKTRVTSFERYFPPVSIPRKKDLQLKMNGVFVLDFPDAKIITKRAVTF